jgi:hypothetical protein
VRTQAPWSCTSSPSQRLGWSPPRPPASGIRTAAPSLHDSVFRWRRSAAPCSHSSKTGTSTLAEPPNNPYKPAATSNAECQLLPRAQLSGGGRPSLARRIREHFRRTGPHRPQPGQDDRPRPVRGDFAHRQYYELVVVVVVVVVVRPCKYYSLIESDDLCPGHPDIAK